MYVQKTHEAVAWVHHCLKTPSSTPPLLRSSLLLKHAYSLRSLPLSVYSKLSWSCLVFLKFVCVMWSDKRRFTSFLSNGSQRCRVQWAQWWSGVASLGQDWGLQPCVAPSSHLVTIWHLRWQCKLHCFLFSQRIQYLSRQQLLYPQCSFIAGLVQRT
jgi:hypothetical protein